MSKYVKKQKVSEPKFSDQWFLQNGSPKNLFFLVFEIFLKKIKKNQKILKNNIDDIYFF